MAYGNAAGFDPSRFTGTVDCGTVLCNSDTRGIALNFTLNMGDRGGLFVLTTGNGKKDENHYLGASEWPKFLAMVRDAERIYRALQKEGKCDELTPCPPG